MSNEILKNNSIENTNLMDLDFHKDIFDEDEGNGDYNALFGISIIAFTENGEKINLEDKNIVPNINSNTNHNEHTTYSKQNNKKDDIIENSNIQTITKNLEPKSLSNDWQYYYLFKLTDSRKNSVFVSMYKVTYFFPNAFQTKIPNMIKLLTSRTDIQNVMTDYCTKYPDDNEIRYIDRGEFIELRSDETNENKVELKIKYKTDYNEEPDSKTITLIKNNRETDIFRNKIINYLCKEIQELKNKN